MEFVRKGAAVALSALCASAYGNNEDRREGSTPFQMWSPAHIQDLQDKARDGDGMGFLPNQDFSSYNFCDDRIGEGESPTLRFRHRHRKDVFEVGGWTGSEGKRWGYIGSLGEHDDCEDARLSLGARSMRVADMERDFFLEWREAHPSPIHTANGQAVLRAEVRSNHCYLIGHSHFHSMWGHYVFSIFRAKRHRENRSVVIDQARRVFSSRYTVNDD